MNPTLAQPTSSATGNADARFGMAASANMAAPNAIEVTATSRTEIARRCAAANAPTNEPTLKTEYSNVKVVSLPCSVCSVKSGNTTEKLNVSVPTIVIITIG